MGDPDGGRALTLRFAPLAFTTLAHRQLRAFPDSCDRTPASPHVGLCATLGGPSEADDATKAARPRSPFNHSTAELKLSAFGGIDVLAPEGPRPRFGRLEALALRLTADTYATGFGRDLYSAAIVAESARPRGVIINLGYRGEERIRGQRRTEVMAGAGLALRWFAASRRPVDATLGAAALSRNLNRGVVRQGNVKCDVPLTRRTSVTAAVTWANRAERYAESVVRASVEIGMLLR